MEQSLEKERGSKAAAGGNNRSEESEKSY